MGKNKNKFKNGSNVEQNKTSEVNKVSNKQQGKDEESRPEKRPKNTSTSSTQSSSTISYEVGTILRVKPLSQTDHVLTVELPNKKTVNISSAHLTDHPSHADLLAAALPSNSQPRDAVVLQVGKEVALSMKPSLISFVKTSTIPSKIQDFTVGSVYPGYIVEKTKKGFTVGFVGDVRASFHTTKKYAIGQSVYVAVEVVDVKSSILKVSEKIEASGELCLLESYFKELHELNKAKYHIEHKKQHVGQFVEAVVESIENSILKIKSNNIIGYALGNPSHKVGDKLKAFIAKNSVPQSNPLLFTFTDTVEHKVSTSGIVPGNKYRVKVISKRHWEIEVNILGTSTSGRVHIADIADYDENDTSNPMDRVKIGDELDAKVIGIMANKPLPGAKGPPRKLVWLTLKPSKVSQPGYEPPPTHDNIKVGQIVDGIIIGVKKDYLSVFLSKFAQGQIHVFDLSSDIDDLVNMADRFQPGQIIRSKIVGIQKATLIDLSVKALTNASEETTFQAGSIVTGRIIQIETERLLVNIGHHRVATAYFTDLDDNYYKSPRKAFEIGQFVKAKILEIKGREVYISLRPSLVDPEMKVEKSKYYQKHFKSGDDVSVGDLVLGYISEFKLSTKSYFLVRVTYNTFVKVMIKNLRDYWIADSEVAKIVKPGKLVSVRITGVDDMGRLEGSMKQSAVAENTVSLEHIKSGCVVSGVIVNVKDSSVVVLLANSLVKGVCRLEKMSDAPVEDATHLFDVGDKVKAYVIRVDRDNTTFPLKLSLKESDVQTGINEGNEIIVEEEEEEESEEEEELEAEEETEENDKTQNKKRKAQAEEEQDNPEEIDIDEQEEEEEEEANEEEDQLEEVEDEDDELDAEEQRQAIQQMLDVMNEEEEQEEEEEEEDMDLETVTSNSKIPELQVSAGFDWDDSKAVVAAPAPKRDVEEEEMEEEQLATDKKKNRLEKKKDLKQKEKEIEKKEMERIEQKVPESATDFERMLLSSPNSSYLWLKYMAFYISLTEIEKARQLVQRALKSIDSSEEKEKINIWVAWMNLENSYGNSESLLEVFNKSLQYNEPKIMYLKLAEIYERSENVEEAEKLYKTMTKKFKESKKIWRKFAMFLMANNKINQFRGIITDALRSLPKKKHVDMISKFGQIEFKDGDPERGRTIFEGIVSNYPKRVDQWNIYIDMELRTGNVNAIRNLFERIVSLKFSSKKMKHFFKRYLNFEKENGTEATVQHVKELAQQYVETVMK